MSATILQYAMKWLLVQTLLVRTNALVISDILEMERRLVLVSVDNYLKIKSNYYLASFLLVFLGT